MVRSTRSLSQQLLRLPDEVIERARQLQGESESYQWKTGDFLVEVVDELGNYYTRQGVRNARAEIIRQLATGIGCDTSTLRDRESMARGWRVGLRKTFEPLTYSQLRACKRAGDRRLEYAEWTLANLPAPVAMIDAKIKHNGDDVPVWQSRWESLLRLAGLLVADKQTPDHVYALCAELLKSEEERNVRKSI